MSQRRVHAGGDATRGPATVVEAIADGLQAAERIDRETADGMG
jgi:NADPH-dependent glutamate synthase beta subunit-like oxidoreductase